MLGQKMGRPKGLPNLKNRNNYEDPIGIFCGVIICKL